MNEPGENCEECGEWLTREEKKEFGGLCRDCWDERNQRDIWDWI